MATIKICDICEKSSKGITSFELPTRYNDLGAYYEIDGVKVDYIQKEMDICQNCAKRIFDYIEILHNKRLDTWRPID